MTNKKLSLQNRVFLSMILLIVIASILIAFVTIIQYNEQAEEYNTGRLLRKERAIRHHFDVEISNTTYQVETSELKTIFKSKIFELAKVHNLEIGIYDLEGNFIVSSNSDFTKDTIIRKIPKKLLKNLDNGTHRYVERETRNGKEYQSLYTYLYDQKAKPIGIIHLPYLEDSSEKDKELEEFLARLGLGFLMIFLIAFAIAFFISSYITRSIKEVSAKISATRIFKTNQKIVLKDASKEIHNLVDSYNSMIDKLEESAIKLAQSEREQAWREMAKQVAHEIKNPLTPMRLTVQSFERKFDPTDPEIHYKLKEYSKTLIQQIDVMSSIASAFSDFAKMPTAKRELLNVVEVVKHATEIFTEPYILFYADDKKIIANLDKMQLTRVVTNLIKNATQALGTKQNPSVEVKVIQDSMNVIIIVADNGKGISDDTKDKVFEPKFTTKSSGMGLGLPMIKNIVENYGGTITFTSTVHIGTVFTVKLPKQ